MNEHFGEARLEEFKLLSEIDRKGTITIPATQGPWRDMVANIVSERFVNDLHFDHWTHSSAEIGSAGLPGESVLERKLNNARLNSLSQVLAGEEVQLRLTHRGRIRLSQLKQAMTAGKSREPFEILWDGRHLNKDLQIALVEAGPKAPLSIGFLDMNGLKQVNDKVGHGAGDLAVRAYLQAVHTALSDHGEGYRVGGDEVIALLPLQNSAAAVETLRKACLLLMLENLQFESQSLPRLSISVGVTTTVDPTTDVDQLRRIADHAMYRAKTETRKQHPPPSAIALSEGEVVIVEPPGGGN